jgi:iron complex outermembrane receptor protein
MLAKTPYILIASLLLSTHVVAASNDTADEDLFELSLEKLMEIEIPDVTSVSRTKQSVMETAASVYVITEDDIKRNGATSIAEALKVVPGMQVYKINSDTWSVSARGFNYVFANKLLVLIDGKSVYSQLFSGVNWSIQDYVLEDIARIEVIRGPGAVLWGANAVNGVINIITKSAIDTQGDFASFSFGSDNKATVQYRHGGKFENDTFYRIYAKGFERGGSIDENNNFNVDNWYINRVGLRLDRDAGNRKFTLNSNVFQGRTHTPITIYNDDLKQMDVTDKNRDMQGGYLIGSYKEYFQNGNNVLVKAYLDYLNDDDLRVNQEATTADIEIQYDIAPYGKHHVIWGAGYQLSNYKLANMAYITVKQNPIVRHLFSAYVQDSIDITDKFNFIVSSRLEYNTKDIEIQPNARFSYKLTDNSTFWGSVSRAVKVQGISEKYATSRDMIQISKDKMYDLFKGVDELSLMVVTGNPDLKSEKLLSFETGYKAFLTENFSIVASAFFNRYSDLLAYVNSNEPLHQSELANLETKQEYGGKIQPFYLYHRGQRNGNYIIEAITTLDNKIKADAFGTEITLDWAPTDIWKLQLSYSYFNINAKGNIKLVDKDKLGITTTEISDILFMEGNSDILEAISAKHAATLMSRLQLPKDWELDVQARYIDKIKNAGIDARYAFDFRISKTFADSLNIEFIGKDLFTASHYEFKDEFSGLAPYKVGCSWLLNLRYYY